MPHGFPAPKATTTISGDHAHVGHDRDGHIGLVPRLHPAHQRQRRSTTPPATTTTRPTEQQQRAPARRGAKPDDVGHVGQEERHQPEEEPVVGSIRNTSPASESTRPTTKADLDRRVVGRAGDGGADQRDQRGGLAQPLEALVADARPPTSCRPRRRPKTSSRHVVVMVTSALRLPRPRPGRGRPPRRSPSRSGPASCITCAGPVHAEHADDAAAPAEEGDEAPLVDRAVDDPHQVVGAGPPGQLDLAVVLVGPEPRAPARTRSPGRRPPAGDGRRRRPAPGRSPSARPA